MGANCCQRDAASSPASEAVSTAEATPMDRLPQGGCGTIVQVEAAKADLQRLEVMGVCSGRMVHVVKRGDPLIVRVLGTRIGLAAALATFVYVRPCESH